MAYVTESFMADDRRRPTRGCWDRTAGQLIAELDTCGGDIGKVVGDCDPEVGAWICFNPVDGTGRKDANITAYRYALVECDNMDLGRQQAIIKQLELPCAALVYSGGKSVHAIVKVDAPDYTEYRKRVDYLYAACQKNGLTLDQQNRNPSRLSRMPGILRGSQRQTLLETNIGKSCWDEWRDWLEAETDELPETESRLTTGTTCRRWPMPSSPGYCARVTRCCWQAPARRARASPSLSCALPLPRHALAGPLFLCPGQSAVHQPRAGPGLLPAPLQGCVYCPRPAPAEPAEH